MSGFITPLKVEHLDGKYWRLTDPLVYRVSEKNGGGFVTVPAGFITDFLSLPPFAYSLMGSPTGKSGPAGVVHDWLYSENADEQGDDYEERERRPCDQIFLECMVSLLEVWWKRTTMYSIVRLFGNGGWGENREPIELEA